MNRRSFFGRTLGTAVALQVAPSVAAMPAPTVTPSVPEGINGWVALMDSDDTVVERCPARFKFVVKVNDWIRIELLTPVIFRPVPRSDTYHVACDIGTGRLIVLPDSSRIAAGDGYMLRS
jgi:hypothetical protein